MKKLFKEITRQLEPDQIMVKKETFVGVSVNNILLKPKAKTNRKSYQTFITINSKKSDKLSILRLLTASVAYEINNPITFAYMGVSVVRINLDGIFKLVHLLMYHCSKTATKYWINYMKLNSSKKR